MARKTLEDSPLAEKSRHKFLDQGKNWYDVELKGGKHRSYFCPGGTCEWEADGKRCQYPGSMASSGDGGGPWFCHFHFNSPDPSFAAQVVQASQSYKPETKEDSLRALQQEAKRYCGDNVTGHAAFKWHAKGLNMSRPGNTDWAKKIIKDHADGKHVYLIALQKARLALGIVEEKG